MKKTENLVLIEEGKAEIEEEALRGNLNEGVLGVVYSYRLFSVCLKSSEAPPQTDKVKEGFCVGA